MFTPFRSHSFAAATDEQIPPQPREPAHGWITCTPWTSNPTAPVSFALLSPAFANAQNPTCQTQSESRPIEPNPTPLTQTRTRLVCSTVTGVRECSKPGMSNPTHSLNSNTMLPVLFASLSLAFAKASAACLVCHWRV